MQQPCPRCGYISDRPSRFCRQCGASLIVESEVTSAATRNYDPNRASSNASDRPDTSQYASHGGLDEQVSETARFYRPPVVPEYQVPAQKKSRVGFWLLITLLSLLLICGGILATVIRMAHNRPQATKSERTDEEFWKQIEKEIEQAQDEAKRHAEEAVKRLPPLPPPPPDIKGPRPAGKMPAGLERYKYPKAEIEENFPIVGDYIVKMSTTDDVDEVRDFYKKITGHRIIEADEQKVVIQFSQPPSVFIEIKPDEDHPGKTQIVVIRYPHSNPNR